MRLCDEYQTCFHEQSNVSVLSDYVDRDVH